MNKQQQDLNKQKAARMALDFIQVGCILGVGTGSTTNYFIDELPRMKGKIEVCISSSNETTRRLKALGLPVVDLNTVPYIDVYVDGADEVDPDKNLIKGGGAALTYEKILATAAKNFVCIVDELKCVDHLGRFPLPVEVLPMARSFIARELVKLTQGQPILRPHLVTESGNLILDVLHPQIQDPSSLEPLIQSLPGVVEVGLFSHRRPEHLLIGR
jgi:ribose 5-phosphate isomerase A